MSYWIGFGVGILAVALVSFIYFKRRGKDCHEYDERQQANRGVAYRQAYLTLLVLLLANAILTGAAEVRWAKNGVDIMLCIFASLAVFLVSCVRRDAYYPITATPKRYLFLFGFMALCQVPAILFNFREGSLVENGLVTEDVIPLAAAILFAIAFFSLFFRARADRQEREEE